MAEFPITMTNMRPLMSAKINDVDVQFIVDSGAFYSMMSAASAAELKLPTRFAPFGFYLTGVGGGRADASIANVKVFTLAGVALHDVEFLVGGSELGAGSIGVLGQNVLHIADVEYDLGQGFIRLMKPLGCGKGAMLAYWVNASTPYSAVDIESTTPQRPFATGAAFINGTPIRVMFDTGAGVSTLSLKAAARVGIKPDSPGVVYAGQAYGIGRNTIPNYIAPFSSFKIGDEEIRNTRLRIADIDLPNADMLIGPDFFLSHRIYVANRQHKLYFTYNGGPVFNLAGARYASPVPTPTNPTNTSGAAATTQTGTTKASADGVPGATNTANTSGAAATTQTGTTKASADGVPGATNTANTSGAAAPAPTSTANSSGDAAQPSTNAADTSAPTVPTPTTAAPAPAPTNTTKASAGAASGDAADYSRRGAVFASRRDFEQALANLTRACELNPDNAEYFYQRGMVHWELKQGAAAMSDFDLALKLKPDYLAALLARAELLLQSNNKQRAGADLDAANAIAPQRADVRFAMAGIYQRADLPGPAIAQYDLWIAAHADDARLPEALNSRCWARALTGMDLALALRDCNAALKRSDKSSPLFARAANSRGLVFLRMGNYDKSWSDYDAALKTNPKDAWSWYGRGIDKLRMHKTSEGEADIAQAKALWPKVADEFDRRGIAP
jgi:tetratricopeptide (TPR) repeat protein